MNSIMRKIISLWLISSVASAQTWYNQTDVLSNNTIALTNKTFDCTANTCLNFSSGTNLFSVSTLNLPGTYTRLTSGQNSFGSTSTLTGSENNAEYASMDFLMNPGVFTNSNASSLTTVAKFDDEVNNASAVGGFGGMQAIISINGPTGNVTGSGGFYTAGTFIAQASANDNGGSGTELSALFGLNPNVRLKNGATHYQQLIGEEIDLAANTGSSVLDKFALQIVETGNDAVSGSRDNLGITFNNGSGSPGWATGISFGAYNGHWPIASSGTLIGCTARAHTGGCGTVTNGDDYSNVTFTGCAFKTSGLCIDGTGIIGNSTAGSTVVIGGVPATYNSVTITPVTTTNFPTIAASGVDTNVDLQIAGKGTGAVQLKSNGATALKATSDGAGGDEWDFHGTATGAGTPVVYAVPSGSDSNIDLQFRPKGTGKFDFKTGLVDPEVGIEAVGGTAFTVSGCGSAGSITGGAWAGSFTVGTGATNCTFTVTINGATGATALHGWILNMDDTTAAIHCINSTTVSATTAVATCTGTVATSDLIKFTAIAY